jgi:signal transduction histidine kinase
MLSPLVFLSFVAGATALGLARFALRNREEPGAPSFGVFVLGAAVWSISYGTALTTFDPALRELFELPIEVGKALIAPAWLTFALGYTGRGEVVTRRFVAALAVVPLLTLVLVATNDAHHLLWTGYRIQETFGAATVSYDPGPWYYFHAAYGYLLIGTGLAFVADMLLSLGSLYREQALAMLVGSIVPTVAHLKRTFGVGPYPAVNLTPIALAVTGVAFGYALFRFELFGLAPTTRRLGRRAAIDDVGVGVVIVNPEGRIVEANGEAESIFDTDVSDLVERNLGSLVPGFTSHGDAQTALTVSDVGTSGRTYELTTSAIADQHDRLVGHTVTLHDVTEREQRRQRLEVLNRVLRHNLRNDMTVVIGYAQTLAETLPPAEADMARTIERNAQGLVDLGGKARTLERLVESPQEPHPVDVASLLDDVRDDVSAAFPETNVVVDAPDSLTVETVPDVLEAVLVNLVENAAEHGSAGDQHGSRSGDAVEHASASSRARSDDGSTTSRHTDETATAQPAPTVTVTAAVVDDALVFTVVDDGPGIPEHELAAIDAGTETPLQHGSGIGLWLVHWGVTSLGGDLTFETDPSHGTTVTVRLAR